MGKSSVSKWLPTRSSGSEGGILDPGTAADGVWAPRRPRLSQASSRSRSPRTKRTRSRPSSSRPPQHIEMVLERPIIDRGLTPWPPAPHHGIQIEHRMKEDPPPAAKTWIPDKTPWQAGGTIVPATSRARELVASSRRVEGGVVLPGVLSCAAALTTTSMAAAHPPRRPTIVDSRRSVGSGATRRAGGVGEDGRRTCMGVRGPCAHGGLGPRSLQDHQADRRPPAASTQDLAPPSGVD